MSRTDINPPQLYSTDAVLKVVSGSKTFPWSDWSLGRSETMNLDTHGTRSRAGTVTANYVFACNFGNLSENTFTYSSDQYTDCRGEIAYETKGDPPGWFKSRYEAIGTHHISNLPFLNVCTIPSIRMFNLDNEVKQKVLSKVKDSDFNVAVAWGEREQTLKLLSDSLKRLRNAYTAAKTGNFARAAKALTGYNPAMDRRQNVASSWLELQYGWLPLMSDIFGACKTLQKQMTHREFVTISARGKIQEADNELIDNNDGTQTYYVAEAFFESSCRVKMKSSSMFLKTASEMGLTNPLLVVWELVPFSFVVDWALPIGNFLSQFDASLGWHFETGSITGFYKQVSIATKSVKYVPSTYEYFRWNLRRQKDSIGVTRTGIGSWAGMLSIPALKSPLSVTHAANAWSLLQNRR